MDFKNGSEETGDFSTVAIDHAAHTNSPKEKGFLSHLFRWVLIGGLGLAIFAAGIEVGEMKAWFSYRWAESYSHNFVGEEAQPIGDNGNGVGLQTPKLPPHFFNGHGAYGEVLQVQSDRVLVKDRDGSEKVVVISGRTSIRRGADDVDLDDIQPNQIIIVVGAPNRLGQIEASFIKVFPASGLLLRPADELQRMPTCFRDHIQAHLFM